MADMENENYIKLDGRVRFSLGTAPITIYERFEDNYEIFLDKGKPIVLGKRMQIEKRNGFYVLENELEGYLKELNS